MRRAIVPIALLVCSLATHAGPLSIVGALMKAFNAHDVDAMVELMADEIEVLYVDEDGRAEVGASGSQQLRAMMTDYFAEFPDVKSESEGIIPGKRFVGYRERVSWTRDGTARSQSSLAVYEVDGPKIVRVWYYPVDSF